jgi:hypothetical protein
MADASFYRYRDARGGEVITNDLAQVPPSQKDTVEVVTPKAPVAREPAAPTAGWSVPPVDVPSFALGAGSAALLLLLVLPLLRRAPLLLRLALLIGVVALGAGLYFGQVMKVAGLSDGALADPREALQEARRARDQVNEVRAAQEKLGE